MAVRSMPDDGLRWTSVRRAQPEASSSDSHKVGMARDAVRLLHALHRLGGGAPLVRHPAPVHLSEDACSGEDVRPCSVFEATMASVISCRHVVVTGSRRPISRDPPTRLAESGVAYTENAL